MPKPSANISLYIKHLSSVPYILSINLSLKVFCQTISQHDDAHKCGQKTNPQSQLGAKRLRKKSLCIAEEPSHPPFSRFAKLSSGGRYRTPLTAKNVCKQPLIPQAIGLLNWRVYNIIKYQISIKERKADDFKCEHTALTGQYRGLHSILFTQYRINTLGMDQPTSICWNLKFSLNVVKKCYIYILKNFSIKLSPDFTDS